MFPNGRTRAIHRCHELAGKLPMKRLDGRAHYKNVAGRKRILDEQAPSIRLNISWPIKAFLAIGKGDFFFAAWMSAVEDLQPFDFASSVRAILRSARIRAEMRTFELFVLRPFFVPIPAMSRALRRSIPEYPTLGALIRRIRLALTNSITSARSHSVIVMVMLPPAQHKCMLT